MGTGTKIYTHGAYLSFLDGFPVEFGPITIGNHVWLPGAIVNPNVTIGNNVVIGVGAVVTRNIPSGSLAMGIPAKVIKENHFPQKFSPKKRELLVNEFLEHFQNDIVKDVTNLNYERDTDTVYVLHHHGPPTAFSLSDKCINGIVTPLTELLRNEFRRHGVRFKSFPENKKYIQW
ncbi:MAG: hypothetical protein JSV05_08345 [Candidatus Bathyarchaeota archaeon]|nr:MAG: hypothetical protein JSV05_08345 [Candidatus Bathyarchaeota archaeon]